MAKTDDLLTHVTDAKLREQLRAAIAEMRERRRFGLTFEHHIPETVFLPQLRIKRGALVTRCDGTSDEEWVVERVNGSTIKLRNPRTGSETAAPASELIVMKPFGDPVYPALTPVGQIQRHDASGWNAVIN